MKDLFKFLLELKVATMFAAWGLNDGSILRFWSLKVSISPELLSGASNRDPLIYNYGLLVLIDNTIGI